MATLIVTAGVRAILSGMPPQTKDQMIANGISQLTRPEPPEISNNGQFVLDTYILNFQFSLGLPNAKRQHLFNFIRRTEGAFTEYRCARQNLLSYVRNPDEIIITYFDALLHFEQCVAQLTQATDFVRKITSKDAYDRGDGSVLQRVWDLNNAIKHMASCFENDQYASENSFRQLASQQDPNWDNGVPDLSETPTTGIWITNEGLNSSEICVTFEELAELITDYYEEARKLAAMKPKSLTDSDYADLSDNA